MHEEEIRSDSKKTKEITKQKVVFILLQEFDDVEKSQLVKSSDENIWKKIFRSSFLSSFIQR